MRTDAKGAVLYEGDKLVDPSRLAELQEAIGTSTAAKTARLVPFFGPTAGGEELVTSPSGLGLDLSRGLLGGLTYEWARAYDPGETVHVRITVEDLYTKGRNTFAILASEFTDSEGNLIQRQTATFIERGAH